jgi:hypothetical protein
MTALSIVAPGWVPAADSATNANDTNRVAIPMPSSLPAIASLPNNRDNFVKFHYQRQQ